MVSSAALFLIFLLFFAIIFLPQVIKAITLYRKRYREESPGTTEQETPHTTLLRCGARVTLGKVEQKYTAPTIRRGKGEIVW